MSFIEVRLSHGGEHIGTCLHILQHGIDGFAIVRTEDELEVCPDTPIVIVVGLARMPHAERQLAVVDYGKGLLLVSASVEGYRSTVAAIWHVAVFVAVVILRPAAHVVNPAVLVISGIFGQYAIADDVLNGRGIFVHIDLDGQFLCGEVRVLSGAIKAVEVQFVDAVGQFVLDGLVEVERAVPCFAEPHLGVLLPVVALAACARVEVAAIRARPLPAFEVREIEVGVLDHISNVGACTDAALDGRRVESIHESNLVEKFLGIEFFLIDDEVERASWIGLARLFISRQVSFQDVAVFAVNLVVLHQLEQFVMPCFVLRISFCIGFHSEAKRVHQSIAGENLFGRGGFLEVCDSFAIFCKKRSLGKQGREVLDEFCLLFFDESVSLVCRAQIKQLPVIDDAPLALDIVEVAEANRKVAVGHDNVGVVLSIVSSQGVEIEGFGVVGNVSAVCKLCRAVFRSGVNGGASCQVHHGSVEVDATALAVEDRCTRSALGKRT